MNSQGSRSHEAEWTSRESPGPSPRFTPKGDNIMEKNDFTRGLLIGSLIGAILAVLYGHAWRVSLLEERVSREGEAADDLRDEDVAMPR